MCEETVADYFAEHLEKIRHTLVKVEPCSLCDLKITQEFQSQDGIVTSDRIDACLLYTSGVGCVIEARVLQKSG